MRRNIFLYLFLFVSLWVVFQYVNNTKVYENQEKRIARLEKQVADKDTLNQQLRDQNFDIAYFTLQGNDNAREYFENDNLDIGDLAPKIIDGLYALNTTQGNTLIPYEGDGRAFQINRVQILNHRWIIADFSDGSKWGELLVRYFINENTTIDYETVESVVYVGS